LNLSFAWSAQMKWFSDLSCK